MLPLNALGRMNCNFTRAGKPILASESAKNGGTDCLESQNEMLSIPDELRPNSHDRIAPGAERRSGQEEECAGRWMSTEPTSQ
jgi:hypothetical protein